MCNENHKIFNKNIYYAFVGPVNNVMGHRHHKLVVFSVAKKEVDLEPS